MAPNSFTTEAFALLAVGLTVIILRTYTRLTTVGLRGLQADDYLMILGAAAYTVETYLAYTVGEYWHGLANNGMTDKQRAALAPESPEWWLRVNGSKTHVAGWTVYTFMLWIIKGAMCAFYLRLTDHLKHFKIRVHVGFVLIVTTWIAVTLSILLGCQPFEKNWQIHPNPGNSCQPALSNINIFVTVVLNVLTDLYLLSIPIPMLWQASLPKQKKIGLIVLFGAGIFVTMAGILRCVLIARDPVNGGKEAGPWGVRETFVAVVTSNIPMIYPLVRRIWGSGLLGTVPKSRSSGTGLSKTPRGRSRPLSGAVVRLESQPPPSRRASHSIYAGQATKRPEPVVSESQEYIYSSFVGGRRVQHRHRMDHGVDGTQDRGRSVATPSSNGGNTPTGGGFGGVDVRTGGVGLGAYGGDDSVPAGCIKKEVTLQITHEERPGGDGGAASAGKGVPMGLLDDDVMAGSDFGYHQVAFGGPQGTAARRPGGAAGGARPAAEVWSPASVADDGSSRDSFTFITHLSTGIGEGGGGGGGGGRMS